MTCCNKYFYYAVQIDMEVLVEGCATSSKTPVYLLNSQHTITTTVTMQSPTLPFDKTLNNLTELI